jgi:hypothetical protein
VSEQELERQAKHRLSVIRHAEEVGRYAIGTRRISELEAIAPGPNVGELSRSP